MDELVQAYPLKMIRPYGIIMAYTTDVYFESWFPTSKNSLDALLYSFQDYLDKNYTKIEAYERLVEEGGFILTQVIIPNEVSHELG